MYRVYELIKGAKGMVRSKCPVAMRSSYQEAINKATSLKATTGKSYVVA